MPYHFPRDPAEWLALGLCPLVWLVLPRLGAARASRRAASLAALAALGLSAAYVAFYLRGGPRIIDATSYWLEARGISEGRFAFPLPEPAASVMGRFLVRSDGPSGPTAAVIFPPGYPAVLALGFLARAPLAVGPLLAAALVLVTRDLAARVEPTLLHAPAAPLGTSAALLSAACGALRYHTADTMSHGLAALCFAGALACAWRALADRARSRRSLAWGLLGGACAGWLVATRPVSALALAASLALLVALELRGGRARLGLFAAALAGAVPGVAFFLAYQRAATGLPFTTAQSLYYATSDGPAGCFRYGFGAGVGCAGEHGDFVAAQLAHGFGALEAAGTTLRRLKQHLVDAGNAEPLALLVPLGAVLAGSSRRVRVLGAAVALQIAAYVPFYFDGNYPGGGARFYADVLPLEHVLVAVAAAEIARRSGRASARAALWAVPLSLAGFAVRGGAEHAALRDRDGGRPMFDERVVAELAGRRALVFVDTDHGFDQAFDPGGASSPRFARYRGDATDVFAWEAAGEPPAYRYRFTIAGEDEGRAWLEPYTPDRAGVLEGESLWPPLAQDGVYARVELATDPCASAGRWLGLVADPAGGARTLTLALPARSLAGERLAPRVFAQGARLDLTLVAGGAPAASWTVAAGAKGCVDLPPRVVPEGAARLVLVVSAGGQSQGGVGSLDALRLGPLAVSP